MEQQHPEPADKAQDQANVAKTESQRSPIAWLGFIAWLLVRLSLSLCLRILLFCLLAVGFILFTQTGRVWLVEDLLPELLQDSTVQIEVSEFVSPDPGHWQFGSLAVSMKNQPVFSAKQFLVQFDLPKLLIAQVDIHELSASEMQIHLSEAAEIADSDQYDDTGSFTLEQWRNSLLPVRLKKLALDHLQFNPANPNLPPMQVYGHAEMMGSDNFISADLALNLINDSKTALHLTADLDPAFDGRFQLNIEEQAGGWLGKLINLPAKQPIKIKADLISERKDHEINIDLRTLSSPWADFMLNAQGQANWDTLSHRLTVPALSIDIDQHQQGLSGWWQEQAFDLQTSLNQLPLALAAPFQNMITSGTISGELKASGTFSAPEFAGELQLTTQYADHPLALDIKAGGNLETLSITQAQLDLGNARLNTSGTVSIEQQTFNLAVHALSGPLNIITLFNVPLPEGLAVDIKETQGRVYGPFTAPFYEGTTLASVVYQGHNVASEAEAEFKGDIDKIDLTSLRARRHQGHLNAHGRIDWSKEQQVLTLDAQSLPLSLLKLAGIDLPPELSADVSATGELSGSFTQPFFRGSAEADGRYAQSEFTIKTTVDSSATSVQLKNLTALINLDEKTSRVDQQPAAQQATLTVPQLDYQLATNTIVADITASHFPYRFAELADISLPESLSGTINAALKINGILPFPKLNGRLSSKGQFENEPFNLAFSGKLDSAHLQIEEASFNWRETSLSIQGDASEQALAMNARLNHLNLADLAKFGLELPPGILDMQVNLTGTQEAPMLQGQLNLKTDIPGLLADNPQDQTLFISTQLHTEQQKLFTRTQFRQGEHEQGWFIFNSPFMPLLESLLNSSKAVPLSELPLDIQSKGELKLAWLNRFIAQYIHRFDGQLLFDTAISGTANKPLINGSIDITDAHYQNIYSQSSLENTNISISLEDNHLKITQGKASVAAGGSLTLNGHINFASPQDEQVNLILTLANAALLNREDIMGKASGELKVSGNLQDMLVSGDIKINPFQLMVEKISLESIPEIAVATKKSQMTAKPSALPLPQINLDIVVQLDQQAYIRGRGIDAELAGKIELAGNINAIQTKGRFTTIRGQFEVFNKVFKLETGNVLFADENVQLDIQGRHTTKDMEFIASLTGTLNKPLISLRTVPALPEDEALASLLFGKSIRNISAIQAIQLASALQTLRGEGGGFDPLGEARKLLNVDRLNIESQETSEGKGVAIGVGKYLTDRIYIEATRTPEPAQPWKGSVEVELSPTVNLETTTGGSSGFGGVELKWKKDY